MQLAIEEGKKGVGFVSPNPMVGCVILSAQGALIGKGHHARVGEAHAEVNALNSVAEPSLLRGAHVYVTLEPCAHQGRTPSCAHALAQLPIASVVYGLIDPNPRVAGSGASVLRAAGKHTELFEGLRAELDELCEIFMTNVRKDRPFVALKVAASRDGMIARPGGIPQWITGEKSREHVQFLRGCYDAVVVGAGTFLIDNPRLNSRDLRFSQKRQRVVLLDPRGRCQSKLADSKLLKVRPPEDVVVVTGPGVTVSAPGVKHIDLDLDQGRIPLRALLHRLHQLDINSLLVEGGAETYAGFMREKLVDRVYVYVAPIDLPGGLSWSSELPISTFTQPGSLEHWRSARYGEDMLFTGLWTEKQSQII